MSVAGPPASRISKIGVAEPRKPLMWNTGRNGVPVMPNGISAGEWLCTTATTSGRAR